MPFEVTPAIVLVWLAVVAVIVGIPVLAVVIALRLTHFGRKQP